MNILGLFKNINKELEKVKNADNPLLLDVRTSEEYREGHIENSVNIPLSQINRVVKKFPKRNREIYVYCYSGSRSAEAIRYLKAMGYENVSNIGGISRYSGNMVKGESK